MLDIILAVLVVINLIGFKIVLNNKNRQIDDLRNNVDYLEDNTSKVYTKITGGKIKEADTPYDIVLDNLV